MLTVAVRELRGINQEMMERLENIEERSRNYYSRPRDCDGGVVARDFGGSLVDGDQWIEWDNFNGES